MMPRHRRWSDAELRAMWAAYCGQVSYVDHLVGILLEALLDTDQLDNTLLVFTSDHGELLGSHGLVFKGELLFEELVNVPLLIVPPRTRSAGAADTLRENDERDKKDERDESGAGGTPRTTHRLVSHADVLPTILQWCGAVAPSDLHGRDIRPLVAGSDEPINTGIALEYHSTDWGEHPLPLWGWRTERWQYVELARGPGIRAPLEAGRVEGVPVELYDLLGDPQETHNLIGAPAAHEQQAHLRGQLYA